MTDHLQLRAGADAIGVSYSIDTISETIKSYLSLDSQSGEVRVAGRVDRETICANDLRGPTCELNFVAALTSNGRDDRFLNVRYERSSTRPNTFSVHTICYCRSALLFTHPSPFDPL